MKKFEILKKEMVLENRWMPVEKQLVRLPNGGEMEWFIGKGSNAVIIIPLLENGEILLQRSYKHGSGEIITEFCAGIIDEGETPQEAAKRELQEETGYQAKKWIFLGEYFTNPTGSKTKYFIFLAKGCKKVSEPQFDAAEQIESFSVVKGAELEKVLLDPKNHTSMAALAAFSFLK